LSKSARLVLLLLVPQAEAGSEVPSIVKAEVVEVSSGSACPTLEADLRALQRRVRIALLRQQRPQSEDGRRDWDRWSEPVVLELLLRPEATEAPEIASDKSFDLSVLRSSGAWPVDRGAMTAVVSSGAVIVQCPTGFWRIHLTFQPPAVPEERHVDELASYLDDPDPWARYLAAAQLLELSHRREKARAILEAALSSPGPRLREAARHALGRGMTANEALFFEELEGTYQSAVRGGCVLTLQRDASFRLACGAEPSRRGRAEVVGGAVVVPGPRATPVYSMPLFLRLPPGPPDRPLSVEDPTVGPYVVRDMEAFWLVPLRWGSRLYLIRDGNYESFCQAIQAGQEPRNTALGDQFLRSGDHEQAVGRSAPTECEASDL
jgi:hypothetical protein